LVFLSLFVIPQFKTNYMKKTLLVSFALIFNFYFLKAQTIPNAGFENWTSAGAYSNPDGWDQLNSLTSLASVFTCEQGSPGNVGSFYLKLTSKTVTGVGVVAGVAVSGVIDPTTQQAKSGFAFSAQPQSLTGKWQHMIFGSSQGYVDVKLTKWNSGTNSRTTVANGHVDLTGMAMSWANFSVPLAYLETFAPDSCIITLSASGSAPTNNDYLWVDALAFTGSVTALQDYSSQQKIKLFPNPTTSNLTVDLTALNSQQVQMKIFDMQGNLVIALNKLNVSSNTSIDISSLSEGNYLLNIISSEGLISKKFIKN
jgi:hypothetical protein